MQLLRENGNIYCPVCLTTLVLVKEWDHRVALMRHEGRTSCALYWKHYRVDRHSGYAEEHDYAQKPTEVRIQTKGIAPEGTLREGEGDGSASSS